jgi:cold shock CspA family protein/ribosome-associated translation inhibitor RaiA
MQVTPQVTYHDVPYTAWLEKYVGERLKKLDRYAGGITSCHVKLSREQSSRHKGNRYSCMVEVRVPPQHDLAAKKQLDIRNMNIQLPALIRQAFGALEQQLKKTASRRRGKEKAHHDGGPHGLVEKVFARQGYGFIRVIGNDQQYYFHRNSVLHGAFRDLSVGTEVRFTAEDGEKGPQASSVQIIGKPGKTTGARAR